MNSAAASPAAHFFSMDAAAGQVTPLPSPPAGLQVERVRCLSDNYGWLVHDPSSGQTASIDSPEAAPLISKLDERGWTLTHVFITHHHHDHCGGNPELKARFPSVQILGPGSEEKTIVKTCGLGLDAPLAPGDSFSWGGGNVDARSPHAYARHPTPHTCALARVSSCAACACVSRVTWTWFVACLHGSLIT